MILRTFRFHLKFSKEWFKKKFFLFTASLLIFFPYFLNAETQVQSFNFSTPFRTEVPLPFELSFHPSLKDLIFRREVNYNLSSLNLSLKVNFSNSLLHSSHLASIHPRSNPIQSNFPFTGNSHNLTLELKKQNLLYFGIFSTQTNPDFITSNMPEAQSLQVGFHYKFARSQWLGELSAGLKLGIQQIYEITLNDKMKKLDQKSKFQFFTHGFFINSRGFLLEGFVRLPMHEYSDYEILNRPEFFGRLGLYWNLPDKIRP